MERGKKNRVGALEVNPIGSENVITILTVMLPRSLKCYDKKIDVPFNSFFFFNLEVLNDTQMKQFVKISALFLRILRPKLLPSKLGRSWKWRHPINPNIHGHLSGIAIAEKVSTAWKKKKRKTLIVKERELASLCVVEGYNNWSRRRRNFLAEFQKWSLFFLIQLFCVIVRLLLIELFVWPKWNSVDRSQTTSF